MNFREATEEDCDAVTSLGLQFISRLKTNASPSADRARESFLAVIDNPNAVVFVAEKGGEVVGFLAGMVVPLWFDALDWSAVELAWWLDPEHRGGSAAVRLVQMFESWASDRGVHRVVLSDVEFEDAAQPAGALIERLGYTLVERAFSKQIHGRT